MCIVKVNLPHAEFTSLFFSFCIYLQCSAFQGISTYVKQKEGFLFSACGAYLWGTSVATNDNNSTTLAWLCTWHTSSAVVRKWRGFHDNEYTVGSYLRKKNLLRENKKEHDIFTRSHMNVGKCTLMTLADL
jgi:hypothetical protein